jgi:hypothetical protein
MKPYSPTPRRERLALAAASATISLSLMAAVLALFSDGQLPWTPLEAKTQVRDPACAARGSAAAAGCALAVARAPGSSPSTLAQAEAHTGETTVRVAQD